MKKAYIKPEMQVVELRQNATLMDASYDQYGMNKRVVEEETDEGW